MMRERTCRWLTRLVFFASLMFAAGLHAAKPRGATAPPVPYVTVGAADPVAGLRALASDRGASYQVFLWRAYHYLNEQFRDAPFEQIKATLEGAGAQQVEEWGAEPDSDFHAVRYAIQKNVIKSHVGRAHTCVVELNFYPKAKQTYIIPSILVEVGSEFKAAAAKRDYPKGTILDRVFGVRDLQQHAVATPHLDRIEVSYGRVMDFPPPFSGLGFMVTVSLSNPSPRSRIHERSVTYDAFSGLEPRLMEPTLHTARDTLLPGASWGKRERGYPVTFVSEGWEESHRWIIQE